jgi:serine/threonine protein kinase
VFEDGDTIFLRNKVDSKLILIESGTAYIKLNPDILEMDMSKEETADYLGIVRPEGGKRLAVHEMSGSQLLDFLLFHADRRLNDNLDEASPVETLPLDPYATAPPEDILELTAGYLIGSRILRGKGKLGGNHWDWLNAQFVDELWNGDVGLGGKSIPGSKCPLTIKALGKVRCLSFSVELFEKLFGETENVLSPFKSFEEDVELVDGAKGENKQECTNAMKSAHMDGLDEESVDRRKEEKAVSTSLPRRRRLMSCYTRSVMSPTEGLTEIEDFPLLNKTDAPVNVMSRKSSGHDSSVDPLLDVFTSKFIFKNFVNSIFLKRGSFGEILVAEYVHSTSEKQADDESKDIQDLINASINPEGVYILKLSRRSERTVAEALILQELSHPYIMKCFGLIDASPQQDGSKVAMITEVLYSGDLWDVLKSASMNETFPDEFNYIPGNGLPLELVKFYSSCVIFTLEYMHKKGIAYRNLRPENVLLDSRGQIRLIDFVFAKKIRGYDPAEEHTYEEHCRSTRSFTLCNSPEYVAPEMIYGTGHDHGVDYWAVGVFLYELFTGTTPFLPTSKDKSNQCEIFRNIADPQRNIGIHADRFHSSLDARRLAGVINSILKQYACQRTGYLYNLITMILEDRFFEEVELDLVERAKEVAKYRPPCKLSIYKAYVDHIASNKALVVDDLIQYKMQIPRSTSSDVSDAYCWEEDE